MRNMNCLCRVNRSSTSRPANSLRRWGLAFMAVLSVWVAGCASVPLEPGAERVQFVDVRKMPDLQPDFEYDSVGSVSGEDGAGCGLYGHRGDRDDVEVRIKNATARLGGDTVLITFWQLPHMKMVCYDNVYKIAGTAAKRWWPYYTAPLPTQVDQRKTIPVEYSKAWTALIDYVSSSFFKIKTYEKDSGLLTLEFGEHDIPKFVDCGTWQLKTRDGQLKRTAPYAKEFQQRLTLNGQVNLRAKAEEGGKTSVFINTLYLVNMNTTNEMGRSLTYRWEFTTNKAHTLELDTAPEYDTPRRTCQPTHEAERQILKGITAIAE